MVSTVESAVVDPQNVENDTLKDVNDECANKKPSTPRPSLPPGRYRLVAWDVDTSGRRLIDEICQIAAFTPSSQFAQYVMPYVDLNFDARRRHNIRVVTVGKFRLLKDSKTNKPLRTKSEMYALTDFVNWLEEVKGDADDGIILIFHELRKVAPSMLLVALRRVNLLDRFTAIVKGFANSFEVAESKCAKTVKSYSLKMLSRVLLDDADAQLDNATERARLTYQIVQHLSQADRQDVITEGSGDCTGATNNMVELVREFAAPIQNELDYLDSLKKLLDCQNTLRPVFGSFLRSSRIDRRFASHLRRLLAENSLDYNKLEEAWKMTGREGLSQILESNIHFANEKENTDLLEILDCHFDPEKKAMQPKAYRNQRVSRRSTSSYKGMNNISATGNANEENDEHAAMNGNQAENQTPREEALNSKFESSSETTGNAYSDVGSPISSDNTPRSQIEDEVPTTK